MNMQIEQTNWGIVGVTVIGFLLAASLGIAIADSDYLALIYIATALSLVAYIVFFQQYTWQIALLVCYLGLLYWPAGFRLGSTELAGGLGALLAITMAWKHHHVIKTGVLRYRIFNLFRLLLLAWIVYLAIHMWYNVHNPIRPADFTLKNALKTYFAGLMPIATLWYFSGNPTGIRTKGNITRELAILLLIGVSFNLAVACYGLLTHRNMLDPDVESRYTPTFIIPGINAIANPYILRTLGPIAVLFGATTLHFGREATRTSQKLSFLLLVAGSIGCLVSGGRSAAVSSILLVVAMLLFTKQIRAAVIILILSGLFVLFANVFAGWINRNAPVAITRPLQWVMFSKSTQAEGSIESSSRWRQELFGRAIAEWQSDSRIFWFGRATFGYGVSDYVAMEVSGGWEAALKSSLRRGATHNLLTDLLVPYGLVGCVLYYSLVLALIGFLWTAYRSSEIPQMLKPLTLICLIVSAAYPITASFAGGLYSAEQIWPLIVLIAAIYHCTPSAKTFNRAPAAVGFSGARAAQVTR